jgi:catechol 2,3-dioxygenase-like lactoylglutathione lyase family enzyme
VARYPAGAIDPHLVQFSCSHRCCVAACSLAPVFDHVTLRVSNIERARSFYESALATLGYGEPDGGGHFFEWRDLSIAQARDDRPVTRHAHLGLIAPSREHVDEFWRRLTEQGFPDDGPPGLREKYRPGYYGAFVLDADGNSIEAVHKENMRGDGGCVDHVWLRVRDVAASKRFYETITAVLGFRLTSEATTHAHFRAAAGGFTVTSPDEAWSVPRARSENVHLAFPASDRATVDEFHRVALAAGYRDNGPPGERRYHAGYYGAFVLDPDGNNTEAVFHGRDR